MTSAIERPCSKGSPFQERKNVVPVRERCNVQFRAPAQFLFETCSSPEQPSRHQEQCERPGFRQRDDASRADPLRRCRPGPRRAPCQSVPEARPESLALPAPNSPDRGERAESPRIPLPQRLLLTVFSLTRACCGTAEPCRLKLDIARATHPAKCRWRRDVSRSSYFYRVFLLDKHRAFDCNSLLQSFRESRMNQPQRQNAATSGEAEVSAWLSNPALLAALIALLSFVVYLPALGFGFVSDDQMQVLSNPLVLSWRMIPRALQSNLWFQVAPTGTYYRPFFIIWSILEDALPGFRPARLALLEYCSARHRHLSGFRALAKAPRRILDRRLGRGILRHPPRAHRDRRGSPPARGFSGHDSLRPGISRVSLFPRARWETSSRMAALFLLQLCLRVADKRNGRHLSCNHIPVRMAIPRRGLAASHVRKNRRPFWPLFLSGCWTLRTFYSEGTCCTDLCPSA